MTGCGSVFLGVFRLPSDVAQSKFSVSPTFSSLVHTHLMEVVPQVVLRAVVDALHNLEVPAEAVGLLHLGHISDALEAFVVVLDLLLALLLQAVHVQSRLDVFDVAHGG